MKYATAKKKKEKPFQLVIPENPWSFHERLNEQQGVFLCPGDISVPFEKNLKEMKGSDKADAIVKLVCKFDKNNRDQALERLQKMNISRSTLFPGIDGFAQSLRYGLPFILKLHAERKRKQQDVPS